MAEEVLVARGSEEAAAVEAAVAAGLRADEVAEVLALRQVLERLLAAGVEERRRVGVEGRPEGRDGAALDERREDAREGVLQARAAPMCSISIVMSDGASSARCLASSSRLRAACS